MLRIKQILQLLVERVSQKQICSDVHCSKLMVSAVNKTAMDTSRDFKELLSLPNTEFKSIFMLEETSQTIGTRKVEDKFSLCTEVVEFFPHISEIILKDFIHLCPFVPTGLTFLCIIELGTKVSTDEALAPCYFFIIYLTKFITPLSLFWMYSRETILALVSSRSRRRVLSELNSVSSQRF